MVVGRAPGEEPRWSGATARYPAPARVANTRVQQAEVWGKPWSNTTSSPVGGPAARAWKTSPRTGSWSGSIIWLASPGRSVRLPVNLEPYRRATVRAQQGSHSPRSGIGRPQRGMGVPIAPAVGYEHPIAIGCSRRWSEVAMLRLTRMVATSVATQALLPGGTGRA